MPATIQRVAHFEGSAERRLLHDRFAEFFSSASMIDCQSLNLPQRGQDLFLARAMRAGNSPPTAPKTTANTMSDQHDLRASRGN